MHKLWIRGLPVSVQLKMKVYSGMVIPFFTQRAGGGGAFKREEPDKLEALHRYHLRRLLGVHHPNRMHQQQGGLGVMLQALLDIKDFGSRSKEGSIYLGMKHGMITHEYELFLPLKNKFVQAGSQPAGNVTFWPGWYL